MKKILQILIGYLFFCFALAVCLGAIFCPVPELLPKDIRAYRFCSGLRVFFEVLPSVLVTGFVIGCAVSFGRNPEGSSNRFSQNMFKRYRQVMIAGISSALLLTGALEIGTPILGSEQNIREGRPKLYREYMKIGNEYYANSRPELAYRYAKIALEIDKTAKDAQELLNRADIAQNNLKKKSILPVVRRNLNEEGYTVLQLRMLSEDAAAKEKWFDSHYYAETGIEIASLRDTNLNALKQLAAGAWNKLLAAQEDELTPEQKIYRQKLDGYKSLMAGENLKAYYVFRTLSLQSKQLSIDPDVIRYLELAKKRMENEYFFIDETFNLKGFETSSDVNFSIKRSDGTTDIVYVKGVTPVQSAGSVVQYLRGFSLVSLDAKENIISRMYVPYAKMLEFPVSGYDDDMRVRLGIHDVDEKTECVPYIILRSVDRDKEGILSVPVYTDTKCKNSEGPFYKLLPMPYEDFIMLGDASKGAELMHIGSLFNFVQKARQYGYSDEVFGQVLVNRLLYPLCILILLIIFACYAWNNRIGERTLFRFSWIISFPFFTAFFYIICKGFLWLYKLLNYVFFGVAGRKYALFMGCGVYVAALIIVSILFLSRYSTEEK